MLSEIISSYRVELAGMNRQTGPFAPSATLEFEA